MPPTALDQIRLAAPCPASWEQMRGDDRVRHCVLCKLNVYNLSELSRQEAEAFIAAKVGGSVCVRLYRRTDGTVLTQDCPVGWRAVRQRAARRASAALAFALSLAGVVWGRPATIKPDAVCGGQWEQTAPAFSYVKGVVTDQKGKTISGVKIILRGKDTNEIIETQSETNGTFNLRVFRYSGSYSLEAQAPSFVTYKLNSIETTAGEDFTLVIKLQKAKVKLPKKPND